jgi:hypothetical protein
MNANKMKKFFFVLFAFFVSCVQAERGGELDDVARYMNSRVGHEIKNVELFHYELHAEREETPELNLDGTVFWEGRTRSIPELEIRYFRGYSEELQSYVFLQWNDKQNNQNYSMPNNFNIEDEKRSAEIILEELDEILRENSGSRIQTVFEKFGGFSDSSEAVYRLPANHFDNSDFFWLTTPSPLHIMAFIDIDLHTLFIIKNDILKLVDWEERREYTITLHLITEENEQVTFARNTEPMLNAFGEQTPF